jgi:hypothetical protein
VVRAAITESVPEPQKSMLAVRGSPWWLGQRCHPLAGKGLLEAVGVALGGDEVGVV